MESLKKIFEKPLPDSLSSWTQLLPKAETETSFDMFGEICHRVKPESSPNYPPPPPVCLPPHPTPHLHKCSSWKSTMWSMSDAEDDNALEIFGGELCYKTKPEPTSDSLLCKLDKDGDAQELEVQKLDLDPCTDGQSLEDANDQTNEGTNDGGDRGKKVIYRRSYSNVRPRCNNGSFPPPLTSIGMGGKPRVYFKSFRQDGRFVLREIRIPTQRLLQSRREDGRLRMQVVGPVENAAGRRREEKGETEDEEEGRSGR